MRPIALDPRGTAAARLDPRALPEDDDRPPLPASLLRAAAAAELDEEILWRAFELCRCARGLAGPDRRALVFLLAALLAERREGSLFLPGEAIDEALARLGAEEEDRRRAAGLVASGPAAFGGLAGRPGDLRPLILDGPRLYLQKLHATEARLLAGLQKLRAAPPASLPGLAEAFATLRAGAAPLTAEQQRAVLCAVKLPLCVVTGGPGTGKTSIVVALLRLLVRLGLPLARVALAAPTGKAANRLAEAIRLGLPEAPDAEAGGRLAGALPEPRTLHRLLGYSPGRGRFLHHEQNPLSESFVIVDEASMIDAVLMDRLLRALPPGGQLLLLGDPGQLPSVDAGAVLRDLVPPGGGVAQKPWDRLVAGPLPEAPPPADPREASTVRLSRCFRAGGAPGLLELAEAIDRDAAAAPSALVSRESAARLAFDGAELFEPRGPGDIEAFLEAWVERRLRALPGIDRLLATAGDLAGPAAAAYRERLFAHLSGSRLLCVTRSAALPTGAEAVNAAAARLWRRRLPGPDGGDRFAAGEPILVQRNDYAARLFNGDQGLALPVHEHGAQPLRALFPRAGGFACFALLPSFAPAFALTVHKAQGSEYDHVALVLPDDPDHPLLSRPIVYTALTRARRSVTVVGRREVLARALSRRIERHSMLGVRLAQPGGAA